MDEQLLQLVKFRLQKAQEEIEIAQHLWEKEFYASTLSNSYYSIFHAARALFALEGIDTKTHKGVLHLFNMHFVKNSLFPSVMNEILSGAFEMRLDSDYEDFYIIGKEESKTQIESALFFLSQIAAFIKEHYGVSFLP